MTIITQELESRLKSLDAEQAAALERAVRDVIALTGNDRTAVTPQHEPYAEFIRRMAGSFGDEPFERPPQGILEIREEW